MEQISHSEITTYLDCQRKWDLIYHKGLKLDNIHFKFGSIGHKVMETKTIPNEELYPELKEEFGISSWEAYFTPILRELDEYFKDYDVLHREFRVENEYLVGVIDCVWKHKTTGRILITDYKFSNSDKGQEDVLLDQQMYIYAVLYALNTNTSLDNISIGYINIPKKEMDKPRVLKSGQLSKDKSQNVTYDTFVETIQTMNLNIDDYKDFLDEISGRKLISISPQPVNVDMAKRIMENIDHVIQDMQKGYVLEKCSFMCKHCDYVQYCKYGREINENI